MNFCETLLCLHFGILMIFACGSVVFDVFF